MKKLMFVLALGSTMVFGMASMASATFSYRGTAERTYTQDHTEYFNGSVEFFLEDKGDGKCDYSFIYHDGIRHEEGKTDVKKDEDSDGWVRLYKDKDDDGKYDSDSEDHYFSFKYDSRKGCYDFKDGSDGDDEGDKEWESSEGCAPVPEPATMFLFGTGLAGLAGISRRKKKA